jgi:glucosamine-6-phosphate deaminase
MKVVVKKDYNSMCKVTIDIISREVKEKPYLCLCLPTGKTPIGVYEGLLRRRIDFSRSSFFNLDEFCGISPASPYSFAFFLRFSLLAHINASKNRIFLIDGTAKNIRTYCKNYEKRIENAGGIDLMILGIGNNGHIGFNEPGTPFDSTMGVRKLTLQTRKAYQMWFEDREVPKMAITLGIKSIMNAKKILLLASGLSKSHIVARTLKGKITEKVPASILQTHPNLVVILDKEAAKYI